MHNTFSRTKLWIFSAALLLSLLWGRTILWAGVNDPDNSHTFEACMDDQADLLTDNEEKSLLEMMYPITEYCNASFVTINENPYSTEKFAQTYLEDKFNGSTATIFLIDMDNRMLYIDTYGKARKTITSAYADTITDNVYRYASDRDYYTCAKEAFEQIDSILRGEKIAQPMKYISNLLLAAVLALIINFFVVLNTSKKKTPSDSQILNNLVAYCKIKNGKADFVNQTKTYSPQSSGSSGSSGGRSSGGGGGGHSGGGHSF